MAHLKFDRDAERPDVDFTKEEMEAGLEYFKESGGFWHRILFKISPKRAIRRIMRQIGPDPKLLLSLHELFSMTGRIDIVPSRSGSRGFQLIIEGFISLYFYQDGDHFIYDGFEAGKYEKGDVTVFDQFKRRP